MARKSNRQPRRSIVSAEEPASYTQDRIQMFYRLVELASKMHDSGASEQEIITAIKAKADEYRASQQNREQSHDR